MCQYRKPIFSEILTQIQTEYILKPLLISENIMKANARAPKIISGESQSMNPLEREVRLITLVVGVAAGACMCRYLGVV